MTHLDTFKTKLASRTEIDLFDNSDEALALKKQRIMPELLDGAVSFAHKHGKFYAKLSGETIPKLHDFFETFDDAVAWVAEYIPENTIFHAYDATRGGDDIRIHFCVWTRKGI